MKRSIFDFDDYKKYLNEWLVSQKGNGRGLKSALARKMNCQMAYVSQVLKGHANFSLEQADAINHFLGHSKEESGYFFLLIQLNRAGNKNVRDHFLEQVQQIQEKRQNLKNRLGVKPILNEKFRPTYFSSWYYMAAHIITSIPSYSTRQEISQRLNLPLEKVGEILDFLTETGVVRAEGDQYRIGEAQLHLGNDSSEILKHHMNWRIQSMRSLERESKTDLHYSSVFSVSKKDVQKIKETLMQCIETSRAMISSSPEEELYSICMDFFLV